MDLARELHMTKAQLLANTDSYEISEWQAYFKSKAARDELVKQLAETKAEAEG